MQEFIARQNIERFRKLLQEVRSEAERKTLLELLEAEEKKLRDLRAAMATRKPSDPGSPR
ncbi:MAG: hypothetical protein KGI75_15235 [Rhizobiaceae bacterium]|nr:hypothetical protein [Rhizobiaceae bacterium]